MLNAAVAGSTDRPTPAPGSPASEAPAAYRPEIDGLRAVAVLAVILNHLNAAVLPGGYLGVDVFFVISGFVITASLARRPAQGLADLMLGFYARRIRRLLPALLVCVLLTAVGLSLVAPDPGQMLGVGWRALFGTSNLILHKLALDYFRPAIALNPFAHTWSLGVEEQFYLGFPLLIWWSGFARGGRRGNRRLLWMLLPLVLLSFGLFVQRLGVDQAGAYYLLPSRFWELGVGCLLYLLQERGGQAVAWRLPPLPALAALLGVMALPLAFGALPLAAAVLLSALLIGSLRPETAAQRLLSAPPLVFLGLISYSLYLWHWSVLSLARWTVGVTALTIAPLLLLTLLLAVLSWRFVEEPLRRGWWWPERWRMLLAGLALAGAGAAVLQGLTRQGAAMLFMGDRGSALVEPAASLPARDCSGPAQASLQLIGDSHAHHFAGAADDLCRRHGLAYGEAATVGVPYPPLLYTNSATGVSEADARRYAAAQEQRWTALVQGIRDRPQQRSILVLSLRWPLYFDPGLLADAGLDRTQHLDPVSGAPISRSQALRTWIAGVDQIAALEPTLPIVVLLSTPEFGGEVPMELCRPQWFRPHLPAPCREGRRREPFDRLATYLSRELRQGLANRPNVILHDPLPALCGAAPDGRCLRLRDGALLYSDADHLTSMGASLVLNDLVAALRRRGLLNPATGAPVSLPSPAPAAQHVSSGR